MADVGSIVQESMRNQYELLRACEEKDREIERLREALRDIAEDDIYLRNCATWHDTGKMKTGVQAFARAALEKK